MNVGGPEMAPHTPPRSSPPGTAGTLLGHTHGPEMALHTPRARRLPAQP